MLNLKKSLLAGTFAMGMLTQTASANFYVIPVGQSPIPTSSVKNFNSSCQTFANGTMTLPYTVPEGKAFVVTTLRVSTCNDQSVPGLVEFGADYQEYVHTSNGGYFTPSIYNYNLGIIMHAGEQISLTNSFSAGTTQTIMISVSGYETRP